MPMPSVEDVARKEEEDFKILARGIWSIKPVDLNVSPGDKLSLESIFLNDPRPSVAKAFQELCGDKYVCIFMLPMSARHTESSFLDAMVLREVYQDIESSGGKFEVICVPTHAKAERNIHNGDYYNPLHHNFRIESCTPFPHMDTRDDICLERIARTIGLPEETTYLIIAPLKVRRVVSVFDNDFLHWHGAEAYPFTPQKLKQLALQDKALLSGKHDLSTLLSTPHRDYVISNDCTKVPISDLQQKTLCLLFYEDNLECKKRTEELKQVYEAHKDFEVVVVFSLTFGHDTSHLVGANGKFRSELKFWKVFCNMPWLALPFDDPKCRQLWRIFNRTKVYNDSCASNDSCPSKLIIIYSQGKYFREDGFQILEKTRFKSYPFMGKVVGQCTLEVREKQLSSILGQDVELIRDELIHGCRQQCGIGQEKYTVSKLLGASVVLLFIAGPWFSEFLSELKYYFYTKCETLYKFEVVYVPMNESSPSVHPYMLGSLSPVSNEKNFIPLFTYYFKDKMTQDAKEKFTLALVTFGPFGHYFKQGIISTTSSEDASQLFVDTFPFVDDVDKEFYKFTIRNG
ncbi:putative nucleoredoxin 1-2 [Apium graveolens]|uniref:putative nucleoredoxin 1-2 n=1 Tax=Apium graveolens TaxID=4045 RepID=UPI003D7997B9